MSTSSPRGNWERWIAESYRALLGRELSLPDGDLYGAPRAVLCHRVAHDPLFVYGNLLAQQLWERPWAQFVGRPSRLTAPPEHRGPRSAALALNRVTTGYSGERVSATGRRFRILDATLWPVSDDTGTVVGQAATFQQYERLPNRPLVEILATSPAEVRAAVEHGADRIEVRAGNAVGGTTPELSLVREAADVTADASVGVMVMIRPRGGDFVYSCTEVAQMKRSMEAAVSAGAAGLVLGCLTPDGVVDERLTRDLLAVVPGIPVTFHRAVDATADPVGAALAAFDCGCSRVLTSGGAATALAGSDAIRALVAAAPPGAVVAGSGVRRSNDGRLRELTGVTEMHASLAYFSG